MNRCRSLCLMLMIALLLAAAPPAAATLPIRVIIDGEPVHFSDQLPLIINGRTLVPLRGVFEAIGADVQWEPEYKRVTIKGRGNQVAVFIGKDIAWVNGKRYTLDVAPQLIGDRTMVPLRFIAEALGLRVHWEDRHRTVVVGKWPATPVLAPYGDRNVEMPCTLRVAIRSMGSNEPDPNGRITEIKEVELAGYVADVLAHEFGDFTENGVVHSFTSEPLKAGAVAILMYAWYYAWHPTMPSYDLDNSTRAQVYIPGTATDKHRQAVGAVWGFTMVRKGTGEVFPPQHGRGSYNERGRGTNWMSQRGSLFLANNSGKSWDQILLYYYPNMELRRHPLPCNGSY